MEAVTGEFENPIKLQMLCMMICWGQELKNGPASSETVKPEDAVFWKGSSAFQQEPAAPPIRKLP